MCVRVHLLPSMLLLLLLLLPPPQIAALASRYLILCVPCLFLTTGVECLRRYMQSQRAVRPAMLVAGAVLLLSPLAFQGLVCNAGLGLDGAAYAFVACQAATLTGLLGCVMWRAASLKGRPEQTWSGWSREALRG
jgi:Na+-driven multidrug efflux pump